MSAESRTTYERAMTSEEAQEFEELIKQWTVMPKGKLRWSYIIYSDWKMDKMVKRLLATRKAKEKRTWMQFLN